jgi:hypothetical protein
MDHKLNLPDDPNLNNVSPNDTVTIKCTDQNGCTWCYSDTNDPQVFADGFLANGSYNPGELGTFTAVNPGTVNFNGIKGKDKPCDPLGITATGHTIIVSTTTGRK